MSVPTHVLDSAFEQLRREFAAACHIAAGDARADLLQTLNQLLRRFRSYESESDWVQTTIDAAAPFASQVALFSVTGNRMLLRGQMPVGLLAEDLSFGVADAGAFSSVIDLKDPVTALRTASEVSGALSRGHASERAHLLPISNGSRVSAVLFASDGASDINGLELVAGLASSVLERKANTALHAQITLAEATISPVWPEPAVLNLEPAEQPVPQTFRPSEVKLPAWTDLPSDQRQLHIRAQRFARVAIAELQLARPEACRAGREQGDLYLFLKREIDKARENYRKQFMTVPSMVDYLHLELIQTAAHGDELKLGTDYPGRLL